MDWDRASQLLGEKLEPAHVKAPPKGKYGSYIEGWHAISEANRIFGHGGWSYRILHLCETNRDTLTLQGRDGPYQQTRIGYICTVEVDVDGVVKQDVGHGQGAGKPETLGDIIDSACKEAVTDALKRALRTFGWPLGLALYDKSKAHVGANDDPPAPPPENLDADTSGPPEVNEVTAVGMSLDGAQSEEALLHVLERVFRTWGDNRWPHPLGDKSLAAMARLGLDPTATGVKVRARIAEQDSHTQKKGRAA